MRDVSWEDEFAEKMRSGFAGTHFVLVVKARDRKMEPALVATTHCLQRATESRCVAKILLVGAPCGVGTICLLAPGPNDTVVFDSFEEGLPNRKLLHWSYGMDATLNWQGEDHDGRPAMEYWIPFEW